MTTSAAKSLTTSAVKPLTTASAKPVTTAGKNAPATTGRVTAVTSGRVIPSTTGKSTVSTSTQNCAGLTKEVPSTQFEITAVDTWSNVFRMEIKVSVNENLSDWMIQVIFPDGATDTEIEYALSAGDLQCTATQPTRHSMVGPAGSWANSMKSGEEMYIELRATNTNMKSAFLKSNTQLKMFRK
jgi:hypothetical protein